MLYIFEDWFNILGLFFALNYKKLIAFVILKLLMVLSVILPFLLSLALFTLAERKVMGAFHRRRGPNVRGLFGIMQPFADAYKLITKEVLEPSQADRVLFLLSPIFALYLSMLGFAVIPFNLFSVFADINLGLIFIFMVSGLGVYSILVSGWASNSKYSFLGSLRAASQMISYEVAFGIILVSVLLCAGSLNLTVIVQAQKDIWFIFPLLPCFLMFYVTVLAEINRTPFDLPEAEGELVSGYNIEYSAMGFGFFFMAENLSFILMGSLIVILFLGGWNSPVDSFIFTSGCVPQVLNNWINKEIWELFKIPGSLWFMLKLCFILFSFIWVRCTLPRYRYDHLMNLCWKIFFPLSTGLIIVVSVILVVKGSLPI